MKKHSIKGMIKAKEKQTEKGRPAREAFMERKVFPGEFYRHFKNKLYQIVTVAEHSETGEPMVVYQALYGDFRIYVRPYEMFVSEVDHEKYPEVTQKYRFERVSFAGKSRVGQASHTGANCEPHHGADPKTTGEPDVPKAREPHPALLRFLDTTDYSVRMECLKSLKETACQSDLDSLYVVLDMEPQRGDIGDQVERIAKVLSVQNRYDGSHLR